MAAKIYTLDDLLGTVLDQVNKIRNLKSSFESGQAEEAYYSATRECGFELPASDDDDLEFKTEWLIRRMRRWFIEQLILQHAILFDSGDILAGQISKGLLKYASKLDEDFMLAKQDPATAHLFTEADLVFDLTQGHVMKPGFQQDAIGQEIPEVWEE